MLDLEGSKGDDLFDEESLNFLGRCCEFSSHWRSELVFKSVLNKLSSTEFMFKVDFGAGLEGRLLGAGGGEGYGRHSGVIGELITTSAFFDVEISLVDL